MKNIYFRKIFTLFLLLGVGLASCLFAYLYNQKTQNDIKIIIPKNYPIKKIASLLRKNLVIDNKIFFELYARLVGLSNKKIIAGEYLIPKHSNIFKVLFIVTNGYVIKHHVTIPEGLTNSQIIGILSKVHGINTQNKLKKQYREGDLYPSTYEYLYNTDLNHLLSRMNNKMNAVLAEEWKKRNTKNTRELKNEYNALILASIIEKETRFNDEKSSIARVYINRLKNNMPLQADPTIIYALTGWNNFHRKIKYLDLKIESPYNTYLNKGLVPTPICNPGKYSIIAALNPSQGKNLYFVADHSGRHLFSSSYIGHLKNIKKVRGI